MRKRETRETDAGLNTGSDRSLSAQQIPSNAGPLGGASSPENPASTSTALYPVIGQTTAPRVSLGGNTSVTLGRNTSVAARSIPAKPDVVASTTVVSEKPHSGGVPRAEGYALRHIGLRGYLRLVRILVTFFVFAVRVFLNSRGWLARKASSTEKREREGELLRNKLLALGPTFIKIGQTLATRADLMPAEYIKELSKLQDEVPPFPAAQSRAIIEAELEAPLESFFSDFEDEPIAAASLGQVHRAKLKTGQTVVIKVQRPGLEGQISFDVSVLQRIARFLLRYPNLIRGVDWQGALGEFRDTVFEELNFHQEALNAETFRSNFSQWKEVYVPQIHHHLCGQHVIVMEYIPGLKVTDAEKLTAAGFVPAEIVRLLARTYLKQLLEDGFFHADPHPGNLRVMPDGRLAFFDFGMVGRLDATLQSKLMNAFFHTVERDVHGLVEDMVRLGFIELTPGEEERFKPIIAGLMDRYLSRRLAQVQFKELIFDLAHVIYEFPFHIPASFTYIIRAMMTLEGIGMMVDPTFSFFEVARPYAKRFMFKREGRYLRKLVLDSVLNGNANQIDWGKVWKLGKMVVKYYIQGEYKL